MFVSVLTKSVMVEMSDNDVTNVAMVTRVDTLTRLHLFDINFITCFMLKAITKGHQCIHENHISNAMRQSCV